MHYLATIERYLWQRVAANVGPLVLALMALTLVLTVIPGSELGAASATLQWWPAPQLKNYGHVAFYALLAILWSIWLSRWRFGEARTAMLALAIAFALGVAGEFLQLVIPGRFASLTDCALNLAGACLGLIYFRRRVAGLIARPAVTGHAGGPPL